MEQVVEMDRFGRIMLPAEIREALHLDQPTSFKAAVIGNRVELTALPSSSGGVLKRKKGLLVLSTGGPKFNAADVVNAMRNERR